MKLVLFGSGEYKMPRAFLCDNSAGKEGVQEDEEGGAQLGEDG